jgi:hypothetical protein
MKMKKAEHALYFRGFKNAPIKDVAILDCDFGGVAKPNLLENAEGITMRNVKINGKVENR